MKKSLLVLTLSLITLSVTAERLSLQQGVNRTVKPSTVSSNVASSANGVGTVSGVSISTIATIAAAVAAAVSVNSTSSH